MGTKQRNIIVINKKTNNMQLTSEQSERLIRFLNERSNGNITCSICGHHSWGVNDKIFQMLEYQKGGIVFGGNMDLLPVIPVTCNNCGNTIFVNAIKAGIVEVDSNRHVVENKNK